MTRQHYIFEVRRPAVRSHNEETFNAGALAHDLTQADQIVRDRYPTAIRVILLSVSEEVA